MRSATVCAAVLLSLPLGVLGQGAGWHANPEVVRKTSEQQPKFNYDEARVAPSTLPDALATSRGKIRTPEAWRPRRAEILELFREHVYGRSPGRPGQLRFQVIEDNPRAMAGAATLRRIAVVSTQAGREHRFALSVFLPNARREPVPVFLLLNNRPATNTDPTRQEKSGFWPAEEMIARGYGIAALQVAELAPDDKDHFREGAIRLFESHVPGFIPPPFSRSRTLPPLTAVVVQGGGSAPRPPNAWGALAAWAWGASRAMDYFETDARIDSTRVAVVGHSRGGKAALWAGAEDERFALVISNESGEGGAALSRRNYGETVARITDSFPHWFAGNYAGFAGREAALPIDQHMLIALIAPRPVYVASADEDLWSDPRGEFLSQVNASPVYALWGDPPIAADAMPPLDRPLVVGRRAYHVRTGGHNLTPYDWARFADFADTVWHK